MADVSVPCSRQWGSSGGASSCFILPTLTDINRHLHAYRYKEDGMSREDIAKLIERFALQPLDFFGALRASMYDNQIREWIRRDITGQ